MTDFKAEILDIKNTTITFLRHPVEGIKHVPQWEWTKLLLAQTLITMISGALGGLFHLSVGSIIMGIILMPILTLITTFISSLFFFYAFQIFTDKIVEFRSLFAAVFFANIPFFIFKIISGFFPPIDLVGLGFTALLLIVAFSENFQIPKMFITRVIGGIYVILFVMYSFSWWNASRIEDKWRAMRNSAPEVRLGE